MAWTRMKQAFSLTLCLALMAVTALFVTGCDSNPDTGGTGTTTSVSDTASPSTTAPSAQATAVGEGNTAFFFTVTTRTVRKRGLRCTRIKPPWGKRCRISV